MKSLLLFICLSTFTFGQTKEQFEQEIINAIEYKNYEKSFQLINASIKLNGDSERMNQLQQVTTYYMFITQLAQAGSKPTLFQLKSYLKGLNIDIDKNTEKKDKYVYFRAFTAYSLLYLSNYKKELTETEINAYKSQISQDIEVLLLTNPEMKSKLVEMKDFLKRFQ